MTRTISIFSAAVLSLSLFGTGIDNAPLLPKWVGDSEVKLECLSEDATASPDWVKSLIIVEANVATASTDGTLAGMSRVLDHLAETASGSPRSTNAPTTAISAFTHLTAP